MHLARQDGVIQLERTGPFMPPITFPGAGDMVVKAWLRQRLLESGLTGITFGQVVKRLVVRFDWHLWDRSAGEPPEYPEDGEPENYILGHPHSEQASRMIADVFELVPKNAAAIDRSDGIRVLAGSWGNADVFRAQGLGWCFVSERARDWFSTVVGEHVAFEAVPVV